MTTTKEYVDRLDEQTKIDIVKDYLEFEKNGMIGDCQLRTHAMQLIRENKANDSYIVTWMTMLATEVFKKYTMEILQIK